MTKLFRIVTTPLSFETVLKGQLQYMQQHLDVTAIYSDCEKSDKIEKTEGIKTYSVELTQQFSLLKDLKTIWKLYLFFRKEKPDIVHTHSPKAGLIGMLAARLANVPLRLHTVAGMPLMVTKGLKRKLLNFTEKLTCRYAHQVYPNSRGLQEFILKNKFCPESKLKIIGKGSSNGINSAFFSPKLYTHNQKVELKNETGIPINGFVFCFVGRMVKDKGINELVQAFVEVNKTFRYAKLLLVGPFEPELDLLAPETEKAILEHPDIFSVGFQTDVRPYLAFSDVFVFPSYREGFPNVVMQAGAMELPCIVTDINGCNEIIEDGVNGLIIPPKNKEQLQEKMRLLLENSELRNHLKQNARSMITSRYEQKAVWEALLEEYRSL